MDLVTILLHNINYATVFINFNNDEKIINQHCYSLG